MSFSAGIARSGNFNIYERREHDLNVADRRSLARFVVRAKIFSVRGFVQKRCITHTAEHLADRASRCLDIFVHAAYACQQRSGSVVIMYGSNRSVILDFYACVASYVNFCYKNVFRNFDCSARNPTGHVDVRIIAPHDLKHPCAFLFQRIISRIERAVVVVSIAPHSKGGFIFAFIANAFRIKDVCFIRICFVAAEILCDMPVIIHRICRLLLVIVSINRRVDAQKLLCPLVVVVI